MRPSQHHLGRVSGKVLAQTDQRPRYDAVLLLRGIKP